MASQLVRVFKAENTGNTGNARNALCGTVSTIEHTWHIWHMSKSLHFCKYWIVGKESVHCAVVTSRVYLHSKDCVDVGHMRAAAELHWKSCSLEIGRQDVYKTSE